MGKTGSRRAGREVGGVAGAESGAGPRAPRGGGGAAGALPLTRLAGRASLSECAGDGGSPGAGGEYDRGNDIDRVVFFSDAVFAIAMTVLALSLHLPARTTDAGVAQALRDTLPSVYTYALSFAVVGLYWLAHHRMFRCIRRFDSTLLVLNLAALGTVAFTPFPTSVLGNHGNTTAAVVFYAATMGLLGGLMTLLW
jgi:hypothetical protein